MRRRTIYLLLLGLCTIGFWVFENFYTPDPYTDPDATKRLDFPSELLPRSTTGHVVEHHYYTLSYHEEYEQAEWVAYVLRKEHLTHEDRERPFFIEDPKVDTKSADWRNYKKSGFDRGHLCPAGDRKFSEYAYNETFYTSNISPQRRDFNAGVWNRLEKQVRYWCQRYGELYIITGGVLQYDLPEIGNEGVDVPQQFYKIVVRNEGDGLKVLAFLMPHEESDMPLDSFLVTVDNVEVLTGIDFLENLSLEVEKGLEEKVDKTGWAF